MFSQEATDALPEGVSYGDPLTPEIVARLYEAGKQAGIQSMPTSSAPASPIWVPIYESLPKDGADVWVVGSTCTLWRATYSSVDKAFKEQFTEMYIPIVVCWAEVNNNSNKTPLHPIGTNFVCEHKDHKPEPIFFTDKAHQRLLDKGFRGTYFFFCI